MCVKEIKEKFKNYYWINKNIEQLEDELLVIESRVMKVTQTFSDLPKMKGHHDKLADNVSDMIEIQNKINKKLPELYKLRSEIEELINKLLTFLLSTFKLEAENINLGDKYKPVSMPFAILLIQKYIKQIKTVFLII